MLFSRPIKRSTEQAHSILDRSLIDTKKGHVWIAAKSRLVQKMGFERECCKRKVIDGNAVCGLEVLRALGTAIDEPEPIILRLVEEACLNGKLALRDAMHLVEDAAPLQIDSSVGVLQVAKFVHKVGGRIVDLAVENLLQPLVGRHEFGRQETL